MLVGGTPITPLPPINNQRHRQSHAARRNPAHQRRHPLTNSSRSLRGHFQQKFVMHLQEQPGIQPLQLRIMGHSKHGELDDNCFRPVSRSK